jgi:pimeloyl-ACP methyl ester carboxylesterase
MRLLKPLTLISLLPSLPAADPIPGPPPSGHQHPLEPTAHHETDQSKPPGVSTAFFASLERTARLVDITYCVGTTGVSPPFSCASRCKEFPSLQLIRTWNTGVLLSDSCGYIAVDHGGEGHGDSNGKRDGRRQRGNEDKEIIVAFRGTYSITNTIVDLSTVPQEYAPYPAPDDPSSPDPNTTANAARCDNCTVHMGFMASWRNARTVVLPALQAARRQYPGYRVHLVGHSLGGAVAALAALELRLGLGWRDVRVTTFGEPRVGNAALAGYVDGAFGLGEVGDGEGEGEGDGDGEGLAYRRVTNVGDPVPLLPLTVWGYRSHGGEVYIGKAALPPGPGDLRLCRGSDDPECMGGAEREDWLGWVLGLMSGRGTREEVVALEVMGREGASDEAAEALDEVQALGLRRRWFPARLKLWQLFFAHRDYFWRLGLCLPGGDPADWGREKYNLTEPVDGSPELRDL